MNLKERGITVGDLLIILIIIITSTILIKYMEVKKKFSSSHTPGFFSEEMIITKKSLNENQLKFTYQKQLISDLDFKHKEWSKSINKKF